MSNKVYSAQEAALAVLKKTEELLKSSSFLSKYETENSKKLGHKLSSIKQKDAEKEDKAYEVEKESAKTSAKERVREQIAPDKNPKEEAEGNNKPDGMEPRYEFKDKVKKELEKEDKDHMDKAEKGAYPKKLASKNIKEEMKRDWPGGKKQAVAVGISEARAGKDVSKASEDVHHAEAFTPIKHHVSAKLAKFMEWKHARNKAASVDKAEGQTLGAAIGFPGAASTAPVGKKEE